MDNDRRNEGELVEAPQEMVPTTPRYSYRVGVVTVSVPVQILDAQGNQVDQMQFDPTAVFYPHGARLDALIVALTTEARKRFEGG